MHRSRIAPLVAVALLVGACGSAATQAPVVQPTPQTIVITPGPVVQPTPQTIVITPGPVTQPTPQVITITPEPVATPEVTPPPAPAVPAVPTGYTELDKALGADQPYAGKKVNIQTQWIGGEGTNFAASIADFMKATGINIVVDSIGSSHETVLKTRIDGGNPPDLAFLAQPTGVLAYAAAGKVIDVATFMPADKLKAEHAATIGLVSDGAHIWGLPYKADVKSLIWYPIKAFEAKGYKVPTTWEELIALSDQIVKDGSNPWCISAGGPGDATGWEITDWVEEVLLKTQGLDYYNKWINHEVTFQDPGIKDALDNYVAKIFFTDKYVYNGASSIVSQDLKTVMDPMFNNDLAAPGCWMQKIPTWYGPDFFPDQRTTQQPSKFIVGTDVGMFPFPTIKADQTNAEGSADTLMVLTDNETNRDAVRATAEFLTTPEGTENWIRAGSAISANSSTPQTWYAGSYKLSVAADIVAKATGIGFDASDLMPPEVGNGTFWTQMDDWVNNNGTNTDVVLKAIDETQIDPAHKTGKW